MAKNLYYLIIVFFLYSCTYHLNKNVPIKGPEPKVVVAPVEVVTPSQDSVRRKLQRIYRSQIGVREATGNNDGPEVEMYLRSTGLGKGNSWCAAFVHWCFQQAHIPNTVTAWSPTAHNPNNIVWFQLKFQKKPLPGDVLTLYSASLGRIHHTGFVDAEINTSLYQSVEGNTNDNGSVNGDGVYERKRSYNTTYSITRWIKD